MKRVFLEIPDLNANECMDLYDTMIKQDLMMNKNHDYGEAWREMRVSSLTDFFNTSEAPKGQTNWNNNQGNTLVSEGIDANYNRYY